MLQKVRENNYMRLARMGSRYPSRLSFSRSMLRRLINDKWKIKKSRFDIAREMIPYIEKEINQGTFINHITRHMLGLFHGIKGAKLWRNYLSENAPKRKDDINIFKEALLKIEEIHKEVV